MIDYLAKIDQVQLFNHSKELTMICLVWFTMRENRLWNLVHFNIEYRWDSNTKPLMVMEYRKNEVVFDET